ncbi:hypothetical protein GQ44DRAFT_735129 [Phaeosphaeriaceae sp. PMI808]|nr:hypothetical protein GQ44DRAFT_735129 [Phaeosphaeriaceae sp. PMI808]
MKSPFNPAGLILTARELKHYRRWQHSYTTLKEDDRGYLPTATEYDEFQSWLKKQDSGYFSDVFEDIYDHINAPMTPSKPYIASVCGHPMYPVAALQLPLRCPVCVIDLHLNYIKVLTRTLQCANGRPLPRTGTPSEQQENTYLAWSQGKLSALQQVCEYEELSVKENAWLDEHPKFNNEDIRTATKALELYWFETTNFLLVEQCDTGKKNKSVAFSEDTNFNPGRPTDYFLRNSPRYEPGKYTIEDEVYCDDDGISEDSEDYSSPRVFTLGGPTELNDHIINNATKEPVGTEEFAELEYDDGDSDWEDVDSDEEDIESRVGSCVSFGTEDVDFIVFSND